MTPLGRGFRARVYALVRAIPEGKVASYGDVAALAGAAGAARQVGYAMAALRDEIVPWHRVLRATGAIAWGGAPGRPILQRALLEQEGVRFRGDRVDMARHRWRPDQQDLEALLDLPGALP
ncbi:MAG: MGMT family protein [Deltaproteobacteria bacterium]|nr:MGMT family protein [Deltaproteobacteria bacterium]